MNNNLPKSWANIAAALTCLMATSAYAADSQDVFDEKVHTQIIKQTQAIDKQSEVIKEQTKAIDKQTKATEANLKAMTGQRGMSIIADDGSDRDARFFGANKKTIDDYLRNADSYYGKLYPGGKDTSCEKIKKSERKLLCKQIAVLAHINMLLAENAQAKAAERVKTIQKLRFAIDDPSVDNHDLKRSSDLNSRIQTEIALLQNEKAMLDVEIHAQTQRLQLMQQQYGEMVAQEAKKQVN